VAPYASQTTRKLADLSHTHLEFFWAHSVAVFIVRRATIAFNSVDAAPTPGDENEKL
jgi:hypothetical protein